MAGRISVFSKSLIEQKVLSLHLKTDRQSLIRTVCGSDFPTDGAENWKARLTTQDTNVAEAFSVLYV